MAGAVGMMARRQAISHPTLRGDHVGPVEGHMTLSSTGDHRLHLKLRAGRLPLDYTFGREHVEALEHLIAEFKRETETAENSAGLAWDRVVRFPT